MYWNGEAAHEDERVPQADVIGRKATWKWVVEHAGCRRAFSYPATMAEHPESDTSVEQLVSVLTKAVMTDGRARRCPRLFIWQELTITNQASSTLLGLSVGKVRDIRACTLREI